jgi:hypothetical protein
MKEGRTTEGGCKQPMGSAEGQVSDGEIEEGRRQAGNGEVAK